MSAKILSFSLSEQDASTIDQLAKEQNRSRSQIVKDALALYTFNVAWQQFRQTGDRIAKRLGIESDDDVEVFFG